MKKLIFPLMLLFLCCSVAQARTKTPAKDVSFSPFGNIASTNVQTAIEEAVNEAVGGGETNTASNTGSSGVGLFKQKSSVDLEFYKIASANNILSVALEGTDYLKLTIAPTNITSVGIISVGTWQGTPITDTYISSAANWNTAYGWGDHASAGYFDDIADFTGTLTNTKYCTYDTGVGIVCNSDGGSGYTNLTSFVEQTAWRLFYSNGSGDVTELALGSSGEYLRSNGETLAPTWDTPVEDGGNALIVCASDTTYTGYCDYECDGTDDEVQINAAITASDSNTRRVFTTDGNFYLSDSIVLDVSNMQFLGSGLSSTIFNKTSGSFNIFEIGYTGGAHSTRVDRLKVDGFTLKGNNTDGIGLAVEHTHYSQFSNIKSEDIQYPGIFDYSWSNTVINTEFKDASKINLWIKNDSNVITFINTHAGNVDFAAEYFAVMESSSGCYFANLVLEGAGGYSENALKLDGTDSFIFDAPYFEITAAGFNGPIIRIGDSSSGKHTYNTSFIGGSISHYADATVSDNAIFIDGNVHNVNFIGTYSRGFAAGWTGYLFEIGDGSDVTEDININMYIKFFDGSPTTYTVASNVDNFTYKARDNSAANIPTNNAASYLIEDDDSIETNKEFNTGGDITTSSKIGVGTTSPTAKVDIDGDADIVQLSIDPHSSQTAHLFDLKNSNGTPVTYFDADTSFVVSLHAGSLEDGTSHTGTDATMSNQYIAVKFTASDDETIGDFIVRVKESADITNTTSSLAKLTGYIYEDDGGSPSKPTGSALATGKSVLFGTLTSSYQNLSLGTSKALVSGTDYWLVIKWGTTPVGGNILFDSSTSSNIGAISTNGSSWTNTDVNLYYQVRDQTSQAGTFYSVNESAVDGSSVNGYGGYFTSENLYGVRGNSTNGIGGYFGSGNGYGLQGSSTNGYGAYFTSTNNQAIRAVSTNSYSGWFSRNTASPEAVPVAYFVQDNASDTNSVVDIKQDGAGNILRLLYGGTYVYTFGYDAKLTINPGTGTGQITVDGSTGGCFMLRDTDDGGWTECYALDGVMTCSVDADGVCDGS